VNEGSVEEGGINDEFFLHISGKDISVSSTIFLILRTGSRTTKPTISLSDMLDLNQDVHTFEISSC
jgi:hypothetical protein